MLSFIVCKHLLYYKLFGWFQLNAEVFQKLGIKHNTTAPYHPQANGQVTIIRLNIIFKSVTLLLLLPVVDQLIFVRSRWKELTKTSRTN